MSLPKPKDVTRKPDFGPKRPDLGWSISQTPKEYLFHAWEKGEDTSVMERWVPAQSLLAWKDEWRLKRLENLPKITGDDPQIDFSKCPG